MHQYEIAVLDLGWEHTELRLDVRARVIVRDNEFAVGRASLLREGIVSAECEDKKIAVQAADKRAVIVRHDDVSRTLRENVVQFFMLFFREVDGIQTFCVKIRRVTVDQAVGPVAFADDVQTVFVFNNDVLQPFGSVIKEIQEVCNVIRLDPEGRSRAAEAAAADLVIGCGALDIEQAAPLPQNFQKFFPFLAGEAFHHGISLVCNALLQKLFVLHKFFQEIKLGSRMERQEFQLLHQLNGTFPCTEEQIYKVAVEIVIDVHAADFRLYAE